MEMTDRLPVFLFGGEKRDRILRLILTLSNSLSEGSGMQEFAFAKGQGFTVNVKQLQHELWSSNP